MSDIFAADGWLNRVVTASNDFLWTYILIAVLIGCALWFTLRSRGVQFRMIGEMFRLLGESTGQHEPPREAGPHPGAGRLHRHAGGLQLHGVHHPVQRCGHAGRPQRHRADAGRNPVFHRDTTPELDLDCWE